MHIIKEFLKLDAVKADDGFTNNMDFNIKTKML